MERKLLGLLACSDCGAEELTLASAAAAFSDQELTSGSLICKGCAREYPVRNGIPIMLPRHLAEPRFLGGGEDREAERLLWEHRLYDLGRGLIYDCPEAAHHFSQWLEKEDRILLSLLRTKGGGLWGKRILYVGSGNDRPLALALQGHGAFMVNLDIVSDCLEDLRETGAKNCVCGDARRLPFSAGAFDIVFSKGSLHHCLPLAQPLGGMVRVLKRGGHILVAEPGRRIGQSSPYHPSPYEDAVSPSEIIAILKKLGVSGLQRGTLSHASPGTPRPLARLWERLGRAMPGLFGHFAFEFMIWGMKS